MTKTELFLQLAQPDQNGCSRWINTSEFVGEYAELVGVITEQQKAIISEK